MWLIILAIIILYIFFSLKNAFNIKPVEVGSYKCPEGYNLLPDPISPTCRKICPGVEVGGACLKCPEGTKYQWGMCRGIADSKQCPDGYIQDLDKCIKKDKCNLIIGDSCYEPGENICKGQIVNGKCLSCPRGVLRGDTCISECEGYIVNDKCYQCPKGSVRTFLNLDITAKDACTERCDTLYPQTDTLNAGFLDLLTNRCYSCPRGFKRNNLVVDINHPSVCYKDGCGDREYNFLGKCYECPAGSFPDPILNVCNFGSKTLDPIYKGYAKTVDCSTEYGPITEKGIKYKAGQLDLGVGSPWLDLCYSCPEGYNRTIYPIDGGWACEKGVFDDKMSALKRGPIYTKAIDRKTGVKSQPANIVQTSIEPIVSKAVKDPKFLYKMFMPLSPSKSNYSLPVRVTDMVKTPIFS